MTAAKIFVIEDEEDIREILEYSLTREGFSVTSAEDGLRGLSEVKKTMPDLILLDLMLPGMDGLEICRKLKQAEETSDIAIVMVTAKGEESDIVLGLGLGADDYIVKPFGTKELVARVRSVLRRTSQEEVATEAPVQHCGVRIDFKKHKVWSDDEEVPLTATEFKILAMMLRRPGRVFTRDQILSAARGEMTVAMDRSVDAHIRTIRKKLGQQRDVIETVHSIGYRLKEA